MRSRYKFVIAGGLAAVGVATLAACGGGASHAGHAGQFSTSAASTNAAANRNDADISFTTTMIPHHQQAVEMTQLAADRATSPKLKSLTEGIRSTQQSEIEQMTAWLTAWGAPLPSGEHGGHGGHGWMPGMMSNAQMEQLHQTSGREFERQFELMMIEHHQGALEMARTELKDGSNAEAKAMAQRIIDTQQAEITEMQGLLRQT